MLHCIVTWTPAPDRMEQIISLEINGEKSESRLAAGQGAYRFPVEPGDKISATIWAECSKTKRKSESAVITEFLVPNIPENLPPLKPPTDPKIVLE